MVEEKVDTGKSGTVPRRARLLELTVMPSRVAKDREHGLRLTGSQQPNQQGVAQMPLLQALEWRQQRWPRVAALSG